MPDSPLIDRRSAEDIERETRELLVRSVAADPEWPYSPFSEVEATGSLAALIGVFGRFAEEIIARLNRAPNKNLLAFLDLLGVTRLHPRSARVPLTFALASGSRYPAVVRPGTQASAQPRKNQTEPSIFETERELVVSPVRLCAAYMMEPARDRYYSWTRPDGPPPDVLDSVDALPVQHVLYLGFGAALEAPMETQLVLHIGLERPMRNAMVEWQAHTAEGWKPLNPVEDETASLSKDGAIRFVAPPSTPAAVNGIVSRWLRARLATPIEGAVELPALRSIELDLEGTRPEGLHGSAFAEAVPLDLTRDFQPFGARPAFGSTLYLGSPEAFTAADSEITIHVELTNPVMPEEPKPPIPRTTAAGRARLAWEVWNGVRWVRFGVSDTTADTTPEFTDFKETTYAFTRSGDVTFRIPSAADPLMLNGVVQRWIRIRVIGGHYRAELPPPAQQAGGEREAHRVLLAPPVIHTISFSYRIVRRGRKPETILDWNDFTWMDQSHATVVVPFRSNKDVPLALYIGFEPPTDQTSFGSRSLSLYLVVPSAYAESGERVPTVQWQYWSGSQWVTWAVRDETQALTQSGALRFLPPADFSSCRLFDKVLYWLRAVWTQDGLAEPTLRRVLMNTVMAANAETIANEILGSSNGTPDQAFRIIRAPILDDPVIEVREPRRPSIGERQAISRDEGPGAVTPVAGDAGETAETWVRWHERPDFLASRPFDRHYVMDHIKGEVRFGDSRRGMIPAAGSGNVRASSYRIGGGTAGNRRPGEINALKTTVPYIDRVHNYEPSEGGCDAEDIDDMPARGTAMLRHRNRAVGWEDYRDLALLASREVGRAKCIPLRNLAADRDGIVLQPGAVSVVVVPDSPVDKPVPSATLLDTVKDYLDEHRVPTAELYVIGPDYVRVDVHAEITLESLDAGDVELAVTLQLRRYLHPLTGGPEGAGWQFGRRVRASELYKVVEPVDGVGYISKLEIAEREDRPGALKSSIFLIYSGIHTVRLSPPES